MFSLIYYIPVDAHERVKQVLFDCGAGKMTRYDECCWEVLGHGQFRAQKGSQPTVGKIGLLEKVDEYKVEMVCDESVIMSAVTALLREHPYEQPAYFIQQVMTLDDFINKG